MKLKYYDPLFYICSDKMPFTIRSEVYLNEKVSGSDLYYAANEAIKRFPYFSVRLKAENGEIVTEYNPEPLVVYREEEGIRPLGGDSVNGHIAAFSYRENEISFYISHVIADGCGFIPFMKSVLYYYLCRVSGKKLASDGIYLSDSPFFDDELGNPYPEDRMESAVPFAMQKDKGYFKLCDGGLVNDENKTVYRVQIGEKETMTYSRDHDGSPCALMSALMTKAVRSLHPDMTDDITCAVSFNLRGGLGNRHSYRMLCNSLLLRYPERTRQYSTEKLCTCTRGMITLLSQSENVLYYAKQRKARFEALQKLPTLEEKKALLGARALADANANTFSVSYVGKQDFGEMAEYMKETYNITDGSTDRTVFIEVAALNGKFDIAFIQGFSSDVYYRAFLSQLDECGIEYTEKGKTPIGTPGMILPE